MRSVHACDSRAAWGGWLARLSGVLMALAGPVTVAVPWTALSAALLVAMVATAWPRFQRQQGRTPGGLGVQRVRWPRGRPFARQLAAAGLPTALEGSVVERWPAARWTPDTLAELLSGSELLQGLYRNDENRFFGPYYDPTRPLATTGMVRARSNPYSENESMPVAEFFREALLRPLAGRRSHLYLTQELRQLSPALELQASPLDELLRLNPQQSSVNLWAGQEGVVAPCHYDGHHNMYAQLWGRKRFLLWPPTAWPTLRPFPYLHPSHAQCQTNVSASMLRRAPPKAGLQEVQAEAVASAWVVDLEPGTVAFVYIRRGTNLD